MNNPSIIAAASGLAALFGQFDLRPGRGSPEPGPHCHELGFPFARGHRLPRFHRPAFQRPKDLTGTDRPVDAPARQRALAEPASARK